MTYPELMALLLPLAVSMSFSAVEYLDNRRVQQRVVIGIICIFIVGEVALLSQIRTA